MTLSRCTRSPTGGNDSALAFSAMVKTSGDFGATVSITLSITAVASDAVAFDGCAGDALDGCAGDAFDGCAGDAFDGCAGDALDGCFVGSVDACSVCFGGGGGCALAASASDDAS